MGAATQAGTFGCRNQTFPPGHWPGAGAGLRLQCHTKDQIQATGHGAGLAGSSWEQPLSHPSYPVIPVYPPPGLGSLSQSWSPP